MLRKEEIPCDTLVWTESDEIMMKGWLVDLFRGNITSDVCDVANVIDTSAVTCGISNSLLYDGCWKIFPGTFIEFVQLLGRLKREINQIMQDTIYEIFFYDSLPVRLLIYSQRRILISRGDNFMNSAR